MFYACWRFLTAKWNEVVIEFSFLTLMTDRNGQNASNHLVFADLWIAEKAEDFRVNGLLCDGISSRLVMRFNLPAPDSPPVCFVW
ncbi:TPA: hypothetical protein I7163_01440 [Vibrio vulnificus]|nr:hypothetical protein [Vibrio vulnificus]EGQ9328008.1 hypothetical protein [Vibrio vulnificus]EGQ9783473.1 hypothetical protein [Vibrio vulnificus]POF49139.1 hypothetical protein CRN51_09400 [Vibrio vulnificus]HAS6145570.1 hypothetical protein [Vibrio vulnificus]